RPVTHVQMWRLAAWVVSAFIYTAHICYERFRLGNSHARAALHAALGAAIGAFGLAVNANLHAMHLGTPTLHRVLLALSIVLWPLIIAIPVFCVAVPLSWLLTRVVPVRKLGE